ncbi:hypothetical protein HN51_007723 [Arachis hypogaea]|uniref:Uncharacterized protein n=2 Tax=Arachis TaxID=3817 RepID=A0A445D746_ARAHY|nr:uncharacterized protein LOC107488320 [Arachis duranensis]XP_025699924.1 putative uncharacterized protein DDB_G0282499 [Arachis hypogaea]RYR58830.1 hypothetical protein Ahy_A05g024698 isoform B [Arachis hypogaea]
MDTYANTTLWDCGSTLYDSFELKSFNLRLNSAIANSPRTLSMSCLPERRAPIIQPQPHSSKKPFNISRSLHKLLRSVFKLNNNNNNNNNNSNKSMVSTSSMISSSFVQVPEKYSNDNKERFYVVYDKSGGPVLSTIPEVPEFEIAASAALSSSEEISSSFVSRSASERFAATTAIGISCP